MADNPDNFSSREPNREKPSIFGALVAFFNNLEKLFEKPVEIYDLDYKQAENCGFAYLLICDDCVYNTDFDKIGKYQTSADRLSLEERKSIKLADFRQFQIIVSEEDKNIYFRVSNEVLTLQTVATAYLEIDYPASTEISNYQNCPLDFCSGLLTEHRENVGKILQRLVLNNTNPNYQLRTIAQEEARIAKIMSEREGKTDEQILDEAAKKYGID